MKFFFKHLSLSSKMQGLEREDELEVPYRALRESVSNALAHRAWQREGSTIGIAIYDDRIEIENAGRFPAKLSPDVLMSDEEKMHIHASEPTNPVIAQVMYYSGLIEKWGRGLSLMVSECRRVGLPDPKFIERDDYIWLIFQRPKFDCATAKAKSNVSRMQVEAKSDASQRMLEYVPTSKVEKIIMSLGERTDCDYPGKSVP